MKTKKTKKTDKQIAKSDADKAVQAIALAKAIDAMTGMYNTVKTAIARLFDTSEKKAVYLAVSDYVKPGTDDDRKRAMQVCNGVKDQLNYKVMTEAEQAALNSTLREFREKLGVKARKTKKRTPAQKAAAAAKAKAAAAAKAEGDADDNIGKTAQERLLYAANWIERFMAATGWNADETLSFFGKAMDQIAKRKVV